MINTLKYDVQFASTGRELSNDLEFEKGLTAITGQNEAGKSVVLEMARFCLWGSAALRGTAEDYTRLSAAMTWTSRGQLYKVERTLKKATLWRNGEHIATGVSPVNEKIVREMGFGIGVFDVACSSNQDDIMRLTSMKPTERKRLIDSVVGIGALEVVGKWAGNEASLRERDAKTIRMVLVPPQEPVRPDYNDELAVYRERLTEAEAAASELAQLKGWLSNEMAPPVKPGCEVDLPAADLRQFAENRKKLRNEVERLKAQVQALANIPAPVTGLDLGKIEAYEMYLDAQSQLKRMPVPVMPQAEAESLLKQWGLYEVYVQATKTNERLLAQVNKLKAHKLQCPSCSHEWHASEDQIKQLEAQYVLVHPVEEPPHTAFALKQVLEAWAQFNPTLHAHLSSVPAATNPGYTRADIDRESRNAEQRIRHDQLAAELAEIEPKFLRMQDFEAMLAKREAYEHALKAYLAQSQAFDTWQRERAQKQARVQTLTPLADARAGLRAAVDALTIYHRDLDRYRGEQAKYDTQLRDVAKLEEEGEQFRKVQEAMVLLRQRVKAFLLPSLNRVSSSLLSKMTGGARTSIMIDDDFNILVDGQKVDTLSGSGKACTNLALRIALGQVLVNNVLSVFLGDEIDGSMDIFRSTETAATLRALANSVSQIILVSHKNLDVDHEIVIGVSNGQSDYPEELQAASG